MVRAGDLIRGSDTHWAFDRPHMHVHVRKPSACAGMVPRPVAIALADAHAQLQAVRVISPIYRWGGMATRAHVYSRPLGTSHLHTGKNWNIPFSEVSLSPRATLPA